MKFALLAVVVISAIAGIVAWMSMNRGLFVHVSRPPSASVVDSLPQAFEGEGIVLRYMGTGVPVYHLLYEMPNHAFVRKELRMNGERGCIPQSGDLPCVYNPRADTPPVPVGSHVRVTGELGGQRILVDSIEIVPDATESFEIIEGTGGEQIAGANAQILIERVYTGGGCELYLGCFDNDIPRVTFSYVVNGRDGSTTLVPGMLRGVRNGELVLLEADPEAGTASFVIAKGE